MKVATILLNDNPIFALEIDSHWFNFGQMLHIYSNESPDFPAADNMTLDEWVKHSLLWPEHISAIVTSLADTQSLTKFAIPEPSTYMLPFRPGKIICLGRNYAAHAKELGNEIPDSPILFEKIPSTCIGDGESIKIDPQWGRVDYEGELGVIIGKKATDVTLDETMSYVCGYTLLNDVTARDIQTEAKNNGHPWLMAKNRDTFCPIGPMITLIDSIPDPGNLNISLKVNGELKQQANTDQFIFSIEETISYISQSITLFPGDIIATGTPEGVGPITDGDSIDLEIPEIGILHSVVKSKPTTK